MPSRRADRLIANHGSARKYVHDVIGMNSRLDTIQAVVLNAKLQRLEEWNARRRAAAARYAQLLADLPGVRAASVHGRQCRRLASLRRSEWRDVMKCSHPCRNRASGQGSTIPIRCISHGLTGASDIDAETSPSPSKLRQRSCHFRSTRTSRLNSNRKSSQRSGQQ